MKEKHQRQGKIDHPENEIRKLNCITATNGGKGLSVLTLTSTKNQAGVAEIFGGHIKQETSDRQTDKHIGVGIKLLRN